MTDVLARVVKFASSVSTPNWPLRTARAETGREITVGTLQPVDVTVTEVPAETTTLNPQVALWLARGFLVVAFAVPAALLMMPSSKPPKTTTDQAGTAIAATTAGAAALAGASAAGATAAIAASRPEAPLFRPVQSNTVPPAQSVPHPEPRAWQQVAAVEPKPTQARDLPTPIATARPTAEDADRTAAKSAAAGETQRASMHQSATAVPDDGRSSKTLSRSQSSTASSRPRKSYRSQGYPGPITAAIGTGLKRAAYSTQRFFKKIF